jgi:hypothetical protein
LQNVNAMGEEANAKINLAFDQKDSVREIKAVITKTDADGKIIPVPKVEVKVYVKRTFSLLPIEGENLKTDESGEATVVFPNDIPGDTVGNLTVIARVEDNDELGELEASKVVKWGVPVIENHIVMRRALWASGANAPIPLVITVCTIIAGVWGIIIYIFVQLIKIKKIGIYETKNQSQI